MEDKGKMQEHRDMPKIDFWREKRNNKRQEKRKKCQKLSFWQNKMPKVSFWQIFWHNWEKRKEKNESKKLQGKQMHKEEIEEV